MIKVQPRDLIMKQSLSFKNLNSTLPSLSVAINQYKKSLDRVDEAKNRYKVLNRQLQKQKSTTINGKKCRYFVGKVKQMDEVDTYIKKWNQTNIEKRLQFQTYINRRNRQKSRDNLDNTRSFYHQSNIEAYEQIRQERIYNDSLIKSFNNQLIKNRIRSKQKSKHSQKRRQEKINEYYENKQEEVRKQKHKEALQLFLNSIKNGNQVNDIVELNAKLNHKTKKERNRSHKFHSKDFPVNMASTIKNPQLHSWK